MNDWENLPPKEQAAHPNTPIDRLRYLSHFHPAGVLQNPILPLLFLEDPTSAAELVLMAQKNAALQTLESLLPLLQESPRRIWLCDCAERVLHFYESQNPGEHRLTEALQASRDYATGRANLTELLAAQAEANAIRPPSQRSRIIYGHSPVDYLSMQFVSVLSQIASRQLSSADAFDIATKIADLAAQVSLTQEPLDLEDHQRDERQRSKDAAQTAELQWQAAHLETFRHPKA